MKDRELITDTKWQDFQIDKLMLGEYCISFDFSAGKGIEAELVLEGGGYPCSPLAFMPDGRIVSFGGKEVCAYSEEKHHIDLVVRPFDDCIDVYVDGAVVLNGHRTDLVGDKCIWADKCITFRFRYRSEQAGIKIQITSIDAYETDIQPTGGFEYKPLAGKRIFDRTIRFGEGRVFPEEEPVRRLLGDNRAIHLRSGVAYADGRKARFDVPQKCGGDYIISAKAAEFLFDREFTEAVPLVQTAERYGRTVVIDTAAISGGAAVVGVGFEFPKEKKALQELNDFLFYERPSPEQLLADYKKNTHPCVMSTAADFERIRKEVKTDKFKKVWFELLLSFCEEIMARPPLKYELRDGFRLMYVSDELEEMMLCLGMAYQLTGDRKYAQAAWKHIEAVAAFPDWNPFHHIDVGIMAIGFSVAYDWMYDCWSDEQKRIMEEAIADNCFYIANLTYEDDKASMGGVVMENNHNVVCNGGILIAAIAFGNVYPELCAKMASYAIRCLEYMMWHFAPDGAWYEGPQYAGMTIEYVSRTLAALETAFGSCYSLDLVQGIDRAAEYLSYSQSDISCYNFADGDYGIATSAGLFWLYEKYGIKGVKDEVAAQRYSRSMRKTDAIVHCLQWYSTAEESAAQSLPRDRYYAGSEIITMRNSWERGQTFVGIKAGDTIYDHSHLEAGSFIYDSMGVRWAWEMGRDDYNLDGYWDIDKRFKIFRLRAEAHNTVVINPGEEPCYVLGARADVMEYRTNADGVVVRIDMGRVLAENVTAAERGYMFTNNRKTLVVRDEITLKKPSEVYWLMYTKADVKITENTATLTQDGKKLRMEFNSDKEGTLYTEAAKPFDRSPKVDGQMENEGFYRLVYRIKTDGSLSITVKLEPDNVKALENYVKPIGEW